MYSLLTAIKCLKIVTGNYILSTEILNVNTYVVSFSVSLFTFPFICYGHEDFSWIPLFYNIDVIHFISVRHKFLDINYKTHSDFVYFKMLKKRAS
jgi:hypothetical protein